MRPTLHALSGLIATALSLCSGSALAQEMEVAVPLYGIQPVPEYMRWPLISGTVVDADGAPIPDVEVRAGKHRDITQAGGDWRVNCKRKTCRVVLKAEGYRTVRIRVRVPEDGAVPVQEVVMERR